VTNKIKNPFAPHSSSYQFWQQGYDAPDAPIAFTEECQPSECFQDGQKARRFDDKLGKLKETFLMKKSPAEVRSLITTLNEKLMFIRKNCPHTNTEIGWFSWRLGARHPMHLCLACDQPVRALTEDEMLIWAEENKTGEI